MNYKKVSIIILNWNGWKDTIECLESLYQIQYPNFDVILLDNASEDDSITKIKEYCEGAIQIRSKLFKFNKYNKPLKLSEFTLNELKYSDYNKYLDNNSYKNLILIKNDKNYGFAEGNNIGIKFALKILKPHFILLLNNDTVVDQNFLSKLIQAMEFDQKISVIGPKIYYYNYKNKTNVINFAGGKINWWLYPGYHHIKDKIEDKEFLQNEIVECDWVTGAALMIRAELLPSNYLNNQYYFGCEDVDLCLKLKKEGHKIAIKSDSYIWHKIGISRGKKSSKSMSRSIVTDSFQNLKLLKNTNRLFFLIAPIYVIQILFGLLKILFNPPQTNK